jgi:hypothetical protein
MTLPTPPGAAALPSELAGFASAISDRYAVERSLGAGGMALVFLARDLRHDRRVALKVLRPELSAILGAERFLHEIRTTANLQHPHILPLHDSGTADGMVFYVMPFVDGETLRDRINRDKQLGIDDAVRIAREVGSALDYAHRRGVVHRDIKPENILLQDGAALVADFGIALAASRSDASTRMTETGMSLGTPHYMAPEQAMGERDITPRADIYALGAVTYEMLLGEPPFTGPTAQAIVARVLTEEPRPISAQRKTIPAHVDAAIRIALEKLPADRFASAAEFCDALVGKGAMLESRTVATASLLASSRGGRRKLAMIAGMGAIAGVALGYGVAKMLAPAPAVKPMRVQFTLRPAYPLILDIPPLISADGSRIAVIGSDSSGTYRVYARRLGDDAWTPVAGTEGVTVGAYTIGLSPDGQQLVHASVQQLRRVDLSTGVVTPLADVPGLGMPVWGSDGYIVYRNGQTISRIRAAGGKLEPMLTIDSAQYLVGAISSLPDGSGIVFHGRSGRNSLVLATFADRKLTDLNIDGTRPFVIAGNWLVYATADGMLYRVGLDVRRRRTVGDPIAVTGPVRVGVLGAPRIAIANNRTIVHLEGRTIERRQLVMVDRSGVAATLPLPDGMYRRPRFSPDGRRLAYDVQSADLSGDIWTYDIDSRRSQRLTFDSLAMHASWTRDGSSIVFTKRGIGITANLYRIAANGSGAAKEYLDRAGGVYEAEFTPDAKTLVFREDVSATGRDIFIAPADRPNDAKPLVATTFHDHMLALSRDGRWFAYVSNSTGRSEVYLRRLDGSGDVTPVSIGGGTEPRWGANDAELFFRRSDSLFAVSTSLGSSVRLGEPRLLFAGLYNVGQWDTYWDVSPDGKRFAFVRPDRRAEGIPLRVILNPF